MVRVQGLASSSQAQRIIRRILLFPFGNSNAPPNDTVSVYLDYAEPKKATEGWHACAQFALVISNIHDPTVFTVSRAFHLRAFDMHRFTSDPQMLITDLLRRSVIGVLLDSMNFASCSASKNPTSDPQLKMTRLIYLSSSAF